VVQRQHSFIFSYVFLSTISGKQYDSCGRSREGCCKQNTLLTAKKRRWYKFSFLFFNELNRSTKIIPSNTCGITSPALSDHCKKNEETKTNGRKNLMSSTRVWAEVSE
jgi:hypothetical protein